MSDEREAIVRWLREQAKLWDDQPHVRFAMNGYASAIERGDHLAPKE